jgi:hypothetical protein
MYTEEDRVQAIAAAQELQRRTLHQPTRCFIKKEFLVPGAIIERDGKFYEVQKNGSQKKLALVKK